MTTQTARKGEDGHIREARERSTRTPTGRERRLAHRIAIERQRAVWQNAFAETRAQGRAVGSGFFGWISMLNGSRFGRGPEMAESRGRYAHATKAGVGRRALNQVAVVGRKLWKTVHRARSS